MGYRPQILDPIYKITPIFDLLSYKGSLSVEPSRRSVGKRQKRKKERNFCWKTEYLRPLLHVGGGSYKQLTKDYYKDSVLFESSSCITHTHTHTHTLNCLFSRTTWVSRHQKGKLFWILLKQEMMGWQWHQLDHTPVQTDNHASTPSLNFLRVDCSSWRPTNSVSSCISK